MPSYTLDEMQKLLKKELDQERFQHTLGVMYTAAALSMAHEESMEKALTAGLLHDCAKCISNKKKIHMCEKYGIDISAYERENPFMLHAKLGVYIAEHTYGVKDPDILSAIRWHTTGKPQMTNLEKIIYIADYIEPGRKKAQNLPLVRKLAFEDLNQCMYVICRDTLIYLAGSDSAIEENTRLACEYYGKDFPS